MALEFLGVGDLHFDGKLRRYLPDLNVRIVHELDKVMVYARRNGITTIVQYGDICETPVMSKEAGILLLQFLLKNRDINFIFIPGNHDKENAEHHSLQLFSEFCKSGLLPNVKIIETPRTLFRKSGTPLRLLPWPSMDTREDCLNVLHEAVSGSTWDHGRPVDNAPKVKHWTVSGHLHTSQTIGKVHYSGTLYQTSFGEKPEKYFHHVTWEEGKSPVIKKIRHHQGFKLVNLVVENRSDLSGIEDNPDILYKVFVKSSVVLDASTFDPFPNVVKVNSFKTKTELQELVSEEIRLDDEFESPSLVSVENSLKDWLLTTKAEDSLKRATYRKFKELFV